MRCRWLLLCGLLIFATFVASQLRADEKPVTEKPLTEKPPAAGETRKLLAEHHTLAMVEGVSYRLCRGLTALCPKDCGHSGEFATFAVKKYVSYKKHGEYGDAEQKSFLVQLTDYDRKPLTDPVVAKVGKLKAGDYVLLSWKHDYVTKDGSSSPQRPVIKLEVIDKAKADELLAEKK